MEFGEGVVHQLLYLVIAEVADTALVGMMDVLARCEVTSLNLQTYGLVGITEWHSVGCQTVHFLYGEHEVVARVVENMLVHFHLIDDIGCHLQAVFQLTEGRKEYFLDDLKITEIAYWQVVHDEHHLLWKALELVALGTNQFEYIWILLVRHDAGTRGALLRQLDEAEVLTVEHAGIESHLGQCSCHGSHGKSHIAKKTMNTYAKYALRDQHLII